MSDEPRDEQKRPRAAAKAPRTTRDPLPEPAQAPRQGAQELASSLASRRPAAQGSRRVVASPLALRRPHIGAMLTDAYTVASAELAAMRRQVANGQQLDWIETKRFQILVEQLVRLAKEERDQNAEEDLSALSDEELVARAQAARAVLVPQAPPHLPEEPK